MMRSTWVRAALLACTLPLAHGRAVDAQPIRPAAPQADGSFPAAVLLSPPQLASMLRASEKPFVLQVGSHVLYAEAHIPGSEYVGAAGTPTGAEALRAKVSGLKSDQLIILYCGCCPWGRCPNIRPAYQQLSALGFTRLRVLYLPDNFGKNWVERGFPIAKGD